MINRRDALKAMLAVPTLHILGHVLVPVQAFAWLERPLQPEVNPAGATNITDQPNLEAICHSSLTRKGLQPYAQNHTELAQYLPVIEQGSVDEDIMVFANGTGLDGPLRSFKHFLHPLAEEGKRGLFFLNKFQEDAYTHAIKLWERSLTRYKEDNLQGAYHDFGRALHLLEDCAQIEHAKRVNHIQQGFGKENLPWVHIGSYFEEWAAKTSLDKLLLGAELINDNSFKPEETLQELFYGMARDAATYDFSKYINDSLTENGTYVDRKDKTGNIDEEDARKAVNFLIPHLMKRIGKMYELWVEATKQSLVNEIPTGIIAFTSRRDGHSGIYTINSDGSAIRKLTTEGAIQSRPIWSPDGKKIAFLSHQNGRNDSSLAVMDGDGSREKQLKDGVKNEGLRCVWSPNSNRIALTYIDRDTASGVVWVINADGTKKTVAANAGGSAFTDIKWQPEGNGLILVSEGQHGSDSSRISLRNLNDTNNPGYVLADKPLRTYLLGFLPDNKLVYASRDRSGREGCIQTFDLTTKKHTTLDDKSYFGSISLSNDGRRLAMISRGVVYVTDIKKIDWQVISDGKFEGPIVWSPDNKWLVTEEIVPNITPSGRELYLIHTEKKYPALRLTKNDQYDGDPQWCPTIK